MKNYFVGELVRLRAMEPEDLEVLYEMENAPESWDVSNFSVPYSKYTLRRYIEDSQNDMYADHQLRLMITRTADGVVVGTIDLTDFSSAHLRGELGIAIRGPYRSQGYAREALQLFADYAFSFLHLHQLTAHVAVDNEASIALFRSCGFRACGELKQWWRLGEEYKDVILFQKLK